MDEDCVIDNKFEPGLEKMNDESSNSTAASIEVALNQVERTMLSEYSVRQVTTESGGQVLDCKVCRDEETGLPRVEMVFCINPLLQPGEHGNESAVQSGGFQLITDSTADDVTVSSVLPNDSEFASKDKLVFSEPPATFFRSEAQSASSTSKSITISSYLSDVQSTLKPETAELQSAERKAGADDESSRRQKPNETSGKIDSGDDQLCDLKTRLQQRNVVHRSMLLIDRAVEGRDERVTICLAAFITVFFLMFWYTRPPFVTAVSLTFFFAYLLEFIRLQPVVDQYIASFTDWSSDDEKRLEAFYARLLNAKQSLLNFGNDLRMLKQDRPIVFLLVVVSLFYLIGQLGQLISGETLIYFALLSAVVVPNVFIRVRQLITRS